MPVFSRVASLSVVAGWRCSFAAAAAADPTRPSWAWRRTGRLFRRRPATARSAYALSKPKRFVPKKAARDRDLLLISDWPGRKVKSELEIVPGYSYKDGEPAYRAGRRHEDRILHPQRRQSGLRLGQRRRRRSQAARGDAHRLDHHRSAAFPSAAPTPRTPIR